MPCRADLAALPALNGLPRGRVARVYTRVPEGIEASGRGSKPPEDPNGTRRDSSAWT